MDKREYISDPEEALRASVAGLMREYAFAMPCVMSADTQDGHRCVPQPSIQRSVTDPITGLQTFLDHPLAPDVPIHYAGGKQVVATHPVAKGDEGIVVYADRAIDATMQQGGTAQPIDDRQHHRGDGTYIPGIRSDPKKLMQVDNDAHHVRSVDKKHVSEVHPDNGITHKSVDPSTAIASLGFDPFTMAEKFFSHQLHPTIGLLGKAVDGLTSHTHGIAHDIGAFMTALNGAHSVLAHPSNGASLNAANALHSVLCHPSNGASLNASNLLHSVTAGPLGAIMSAFGGKHTVSALASGLSLQSATSIALSCPAGGLSLPSGGVSSGSLAPGAASTNVGTVGGDLSGTLPNPTVVSIAHLAGMDKLPRAASDSAAAALTPSVPVGSPYLNTSVSSGVALLAIRIA